jgi:hypothetical protein
MVLHASVSYGYKRTRKYSNGTGSVWSYHNESVAPEWSPDVAGIFYDDYTTTSRMFVSPMAPLGLCFKEQEQEKQKN